MKESPLVWHAWNSALALAFALCLMLISAAPGSAQFRQTYSTRSQQSSGPVIKYGGGLVYPEFKHGNYTVRWLKDQMPLRVWVSRGSSIDKFIDPTMGAPVVNVDNVVAWPPFVAKLLQQPEQMANLPTADGFTEMHFKAALDGINLWKPFEKEGLFSFQFVNDPAEADIHVFWTHHFVNKMGLALFANDIRGLTSKEIFPVKAVLANPQAADFKPVVIILRTSEADGQVMPYAKMRAAAAHEFGHALGIDGHSSNAVDLMSKYYGNGVVSVNDAATIRYLYRLTPDLMP